MMMRRPIHSFEVMGILIAALLLIRLREIRGALVLIGGDPDTLKGHSQGVCRAEGSRVAGIAGVSTGA
jgi:malonyl CoA-acyl carrier protein transacylase